MSKDNNTVRVSTFPGCTTKDMRDHIKPTIRKKADQLIIHVGTNSLRDTPAYLQDLFSIRSTPCNLRDSEIKLNLPKPHTKYCKRALGYSGALLWNSLPVNLRNSDSFGYFKRELDKYFITIVSRAPTRQSCNTVLFN